MKNFIVLHIEHYGDLIRYLNMNWKLFIFFLLAAHILASCTEPEEIVDGMAPIYGSPDDFSMIRFEAPRPSDNHGSIVLYNQFVFINEKNKGIHIIDNQDPLNPVRLGFLQIPGNSIFNIQDGFLYADNSIHLLIIDISDLKAPKVVSFIPNHYENSLVQEIFPIGYSGKFECARAEKGIVLGWEIKKIVNPKCFTN